MAAQVEVQGGEVGRTMTGGRLHLSPLTDSSPSLTESHIITPEAKKPVPGPKPRLTPKPFALEKSTIKPILAPKPQTTPRLESTNIAGYKPELPNSPKPQQPVAIVKPTPVSTNSSRPATTSFRTAAKVNAGQTVKPTVHPFKPAPPLDAVDTNKSTPPLPAERQNPKNQRTPMQGGASIARAKSLGFLNQIDKEDEENKSVTVVPPRPQPRGSRPRPVSAVFVTDPEMPVPAPRLAGGNPLSSDLTSKFESIGLSLHRKTVKSNVKESNASVKPLQQNTQQEKHSSNILRVKPSSTDEHSDRIVENIILKEIKEDQRGGSIKSRINLLLDSSSMLEAVSSEQKSDILSPEQTTIENEPQVDVKQLIKQLTVETTPTQSPVLKPLKPRQLHSDLTKKFSSETSSDFGKASLLEASTDSQITQGPQSRIEAADLSGKMAVDFQDQLQQGSSHSEEAEPVSSATSNQSGVEVQTVLVSLPPDNNVERSNMNNGAEYLSSPSFRGGRKEDTGTLLTSTYKDPVSPSPQRVNHAVDTVQTVGERRAVSESIPLAQREDKAMTLRSRRSEGNKPMMETTDLIKGETTLAMAMEQQPRYLRIGSLQKWPVTGIPQDVDVDVDNGAQKQSQRVKEVDLIKDKDRQREADHEEIAGAPKRMKTLPADEKSKHKATYFALTGQIQEPVSSSDTGCDIIYPVAPYDDIDSGQVNAQGKVAAVKRNLSLNETSGKKTLELKEIVRRTSHIAARHVVSTLVEPTAEKMTEVIKREQRTEDEGQNGKLKIINEDQRRQMEIEKQAMLQFAQMKEREMQREFERRKAFERDKQKQKEIQNRNQQEIVFEGHEDTEKQKRLCSEQEKANRQEREIQMRQEVEKQKDLARQRALEKQRRQEMHKQREREMEIQQNLQRQREQELERQQELMRKREEEMENQLQQMRMRQQERERLQELERQQELMRFREMETERLQEQMRLNEQEKEREELRRLREQESEWQKELERQVEMERQQEVIRLKEQERERQQEIERQRELARLAEQVENRQREVGRRQEQMRPREQPMERPREPEHERQELDRQQEFLWQREREIERQREVERQQIKLMQQEQARLKEQEIQRRREIELQKEHENARRREIEMQQEEQRQRDQEMDRQRELMWLREQELERQREHAQQEHLRVKALEMERLLQLERQEREQQKEKQQEYERQQEQMKLREKESERRRELQQQEQLRMREQETERLRDLERQQREQETERQQELERQQEKARLREQETERRRELQRRQEQLRQEEQERVRRQELELLRQRELEMERQRELERQQQHLRQKEQEMQRLRELAQHQEEMRLKEQERLRGFHQQQEMEQERQRSWERQRQKDEARQTELDKETRLLEMQRNKRIEEQERFQKKKEERLRESYPGQRHRERAEPDVVRLKGSDKERDKQRQVEMECEDEVERQRLKEVDKLRGSQREKQLHAERKTQRLRHQASQNERLGWEPEEEKMEKAEADRMRQIARHQEAERLRLKEKQRKEEQERTAMDQSPLRPKVVDVDSLLRAATSQHVDPALRWKEPSPRTDERYRSSILDVDSFRSQSHLSSNQDLLSVSGIQEINSPVGTRISRLSPERDITWKVPPQPSANFTSAEWTVPPHDPLAPQPTDMPYNKTHPEPRKQTTKISPEQLLLRQEEHSSAVQSHSRRRQGEAMFLDPFVQREEILGAYSRVPVDQVWLPREFKSPDDQEVVWKHRRSQGSKEVNRMRSRSMSRRSAPSGFALEKNISRIRSRSAHREQSGQNWEQQKQDVIDENDRKESITPVGEIDSQYGTWDTGLRTDDSLTPATPSSESNLSPSPRNATPSHPQSEPDSFDGPPQPPPKPEKQPLLFPDAPTILLDTAVLRSRVQLGKKRAPRTRPSRAARQNSSQAGEGAATSDDWLYRDSTEEKAERETDQVDSEEQPAAIFASQPQRIALFPGVDSQAIKIQLKKRSDSDNPTGLASPSLSSRSPKSPFLPRAARVLPPAGGMENGEEESPQWLKELKSKKRLSQYESES